MVRLPSCSTVEPSLPLEPRTMKPASPWASPGWAMEYERMIENNCRMVHGSHVELSVVTSVDKTQPQAHWGAHVLGTVNGRRSYILYATAGSHIEALRKLHGASAEEVAKHIEENSFAAAVRHVEERRTRWGINRKRGQLLYPFVKFTNDSDSSGDEDDRDDGQSSVMSDVSASSDTTQETPDAPASSDECTVPHSPRPPRPPRPMIPVEHLAPVSAMAEPTCAIPASWAPPSPTAAPALPKPASHHPQPGNARLNRPVLADIKFHIQSPVYGSLTVLERCIFDYHPVEKQVRRILHRHFDRFPRAPPWRPSNKTIDCMSVRLVSVAVDGETCLLGDGMFDLSAFAVGPATKGVSMVFDVEKDPRI